MATHQDSIGLFMKSDSDGITDGQNNALSLGIKTTPEHIQEFTNWDNTVTSLNAVQKARFDDIQPDSLSYTDIYKFPKKSSGGGGGFGGGTSSIDTDQIELTLTEDWKVNNLVIADDISFVAHDEYTDLVKKYTASEDSGPLVQPFISTATYSGGSGEKDQGIRITGIPLPNPQTGSYKNTFLKLTFTGKTSPESGGSEVTHSNLVGKTYYFKYDETQSGAYDIDDCGSLSGSTTTHKTLGSWTVIDPDSMDDPLSTSMSWSSPTIAINYVAPDDDSNITGSGNDDGDGTLREAYAIGTSLSVAATFIPVRECGKVDVYIRKTGIISDVTGNFVTSNEHKLNSYDKVKISGALFTFGYTSLVDKHPMNGVKYVKYSSADTFILYDDADLTTLTDTDNLRDSGDGVIWTSIGNSNDSTEQSWDFYGSLFSPNGVNGYSKTGEGTSLRTTKITSNQTLGGLSIDFDLYEDGYTAYDLDNAIPLADDSTLKNFDLGDHWVDYYPYYTSLPYKGYRFGCDLDFKFIQTSGTSKIYNLIVGERGSDVSVDLYGFDDAELVDGDEENYSKLVNNKVESAGRVRKVPYNFPYGRYHLFEVTVDKYSRISAITHKNTYNGGSDFDSNTVNPWSSLENKDTVDAYGEQLTTYTGLNDLEALRSNRYWYKGLLYHWYDTTDTLVRSGGTDTDYYSDKGTPTIGPSSSGGGGGMGDWYIFGWVDSFGKSVALDTTMAFTSSDVKEDIGDLKGAASVGYIHTDTISEGAISAARQYIYDNTRYGFTGGFAAQKNKAEAFAKCMLAKEGILTWGQYNISESGQKPGIYFYDYSTGTPQFSNIIVSQSKIGDVSGDSSDDIFGSYFRCHKDLLVANTYDVVNEFGLRHPNKHQYMFVFTKSRYGNLEYTQKIAPAFNKKDSKYPGTLQTDFNLKALQNITYDNRQDGSVTWRLDLTNRFDIFEDKILLRDPVEFILFQKSYRDQNRSIDTKNTITASLENYLVFEEDFNTGPDNLDTSVWNLNNVYQYDFTHRYGLQNTALIYDQIYRHNTLVYFFDIPINDQVFSEFFDLTIRLDSEQIKTLFNNIDYTNTTPVLPKIILYQYDPRSMISLFGDAGVSPQKYSESAPLYRGGANDLYWYFENDVSDTGLAGSSLYYQCADTNTNKSLPHANIFTPTYTNLVGVDGISTTSYEGTITIPNIQKYIIWENLTKDGSDYTRSFVTSPGSSDTYNLTFNDSSAESYNSSYVGKTIRATIAIGIVSQDIEDFNAESSCDYTNQIAPYREPKTGKYSYINTGGDHDFRNEIRLKSVDLSFKYIDKMNVRRFMTKFHKVAAFDYGSAASTNLSDGNRHFPLDYTGTIYTDNDFHKSVNNDIIRFGTSVAAAQLDEGVAPLQGTYSKSVQIITNQHVTTNDTGALGGVYWYVLNDSLVKGSRTTGGGSSGQTLIEGPWLGGFDIQEPEYLPLSIISWDMASGTAPAIIGGSLPSSGNMVIHTAGIDAKNASMVLRMGPANLDASMPLTIKPIGTKSGVIPLVGPYLKGYDSPPNSGTLYIKGPDATGSMTLYTQPPVPIATDIDLYIQPPIPISGWDLRPPLFVNAHRAFNTPPAVYPNLYLQGSIAASGWDNPDTGLRPTLFIKQNVVTASGVLHIAGPTQKTNTASLTLNSEPLNSGITLFMEPTSIDSSASTTLWIGKKDSAKSLDLVFHANRLNSSTTLFTKSQSTKSNSLDNSPTARCGIGDRQKIFDISPHAEPEIIATQTNSITRERYYGTDYQYGFNYINNLGSKLDVLNTNNAQTFFSEYLKKESFDTNGEYLVIAVNTSDTYADVIEDVQIFQILSDDSVNLHTTYSTAIADLQTKSVIPSSSLSETIVYKDAKISAANRIALAARVSYIELIDEALVTTYKNVILILNSSFTVEAAIGEVYDPTSLADSVMGSSLFWQEEDLYYDKQTPSFGDIYSLKYSDLYLVETRVAKFEDTSFMAKYIEGTEFLSPNIKTAFGARIQVYDDIMFIGAPLFDGYITQNTLTSFHYYSPRGAVLIYTKSGGTWSHYDTVYCGGFTSANISSSSYSIDYDMGLFGYDFDYNPVSSKLVVSEPGNKKAYRFQVNSDVSANLEETYTGTSDDQDFGFAISSCGYNDAITFSKTGSGKIYNLTTGTSYTFNLDNTDDEILPYVPVGSVLQSSSEEIYIAKVLTFATSAQLLVARKFNYKYGNQTSDSTLQKFTLLKISKLLDKTLFISGPKQSTGSLGLYLKPYEASTASTSLTISKNEVTSGIPLYMMVPSGMVADMNLVMKQKEVLDVPLFIEGLFESGVNTAPFVIHGPSGDSNNANLFMPTIGRPSQPLSLNIQSTSGSGVLGTSLLFIDEGTRAPLSGIANTSLFLDAPRTADVSGMSSDANVYISGGNAGNTTSNLGVTMYSPQSSGVSNAMSMAIAIEDSILPTGVMTSGISLVMGSGYGTTSYGIANIAPLLIKSSYPASGDMSLYLNRPAGNVMNLFLENTMATGVMSIVTSGTFGSTNSMGLFASGVGAPNATGILYIRGYED